MKITYDKSINETFLSTIQARFEPNIRFLPDWCSHLLIFYTTDNPNGFTLSCSPNYHYRYVQMTVYPAFFEDTGWEVSIMHEIQHCVLYPYVNFAESIIDNFISEGPTHNFLKSELVNAEESVAQDLAELAIKLKYA